jgi:hypothetical protein
MELQVSGSFLGNVSVHSWARATTGVATTSPTSVMNSPRRIAGAAEDQERNNVPANSPEGGKISALGQKATFRQLSGMSALLPKPGVAHL